MPKIVPLTRNRNAHRNMLARALWAAYNKTTCTPEAISAGCNIKVFNSLFEKEKLSGQKVAAPQFRIWSPTTLLSVALWGLTNVDRTGNSAVLMMWPQLKTDAKRTGYVDLDVFSSVLMIGEFLLLIPPNCRTQSSSVYRHVRVSQAWSYGHRDSYL